ncbi:MAG: PKD domain-containing protein [Chitinophagales bacterium]|nr:PKD domain-containing protein [Chitinophagales bacterium]
MMKKLYSLWLLCCCCFSMNVIAQNCNNLAATVQIIDGGGCTTFCTSIAEVIVTGGTPPYFYSWSSGISGPIADGLCPGTYIVTVTDANNCTTTASFFVNTSIPIFVSLILAEQPGCNACSGVIVPQVSGGTPPYTYTWTTGDTNMTIANACAGQTYAVTVSDAVGCSGWSSIYVDCYEPIITQAATCNLCNGVANFPAPQDSIATTFYIVTGSNGFSTQLMGNTLTGLCPGDYSYFSTGTGGPVQGTFTIENLDLPFTADANFTTSAGNGPTVQVCTGQSIQFTASESNMAVAWDFGDGTTSDLLQPTHTYNNVGTYTVTLDANGCEDSDTHSITIEVEQGIAPQITCASLSCPSAPSEVYTTDVVCDTYNWTVNGGTISAGQNTNTITVSWDDVPLGTVNLTVGDCDGSTICNPVGSISVPLMSNNWVIEGDPIVCQNTTHVYSVPMYASVTYNWAVSPSSSGTIIWQDNNQVAVQWNTTDGVLAVGANSYLVDCSAFNDLAVEVNLTYSVSGTETLCTGATATYTASAGQHNWTVSGDATIVGNANNTNSVTVQAGNSNFVVTATPINTTQYCDFPQSVAVTVAAPPAAPQVSGENIICPDHVYTYNIVGAATGLSYDWDIVGGTPSSASGSTVSVIWDNSASHSLSVTAQSNTAPYCTSASTLFIANTLQSISITGIDELCAGDIIDYTALPLLPDIDYVWTITPAEAGSVISGQGNNVVQVQWYNDYPNAVLNVAVCNATDALPITIHAAIVPTVSQNMDLCEGSNVTLAVLPNNYSQYTWGGGQNTATITATAGGSYVVTVTDANGCTANTAYQLHAYPLPNATIGLQDYGVMCIQNPINIAVSALESPGYSYEWEVNNTPLATTSNTYLHIGDAQAASFTYQVTVTDENNCTNVSAPVIISQVNCASGVCSGSCPNPNGGGGCVVAADSYIGFEPILPHCETVIFDNTSVGANSYQWDYGDGSLLDWTNTTNDMTHTYDEANFYQVFIYGYFPNLNAPPAECLAAAVRTVEIPLSADFDYIKPCLNTPTEFTDRSQHTDNSNITSWQWDFGDGQTATDQNPSHTYAAEGNYTVNLTVSDGVCSNSISKTVSVNALPNAAFSTVGIICENTPATLSLNNPSPTHINWEWDFGDDSNVTAEQGNHTYLQDGIYNVTVVVTDSYGCSNSAVQSIEVLPVTIENITANDLNACVGETITLTAPQGTAYTWSDTNGSNTATLVVDISGGYAVTVTQSNGCTYKTPEVAVNFSPAPAASITPDGINQICPNSSIVLSANQGDNLVYAWSNGTNNSTITVLHSQLPPAGSTFTVTVTDSDSGCSAISNVVTIQAAPLTNPSIMPGGIVQLCEGESQQLTASHPTISDFVWNTGNTTATITASASGNYVVSVTDGNGCVTTAQTTVSVNNGMNMAAIPTGCYEYCENDPPIVIPATFASYTWLKDGVVYSFGNSLIPTESGDYQLVVSNNWGCTDTSEVLTLEIIDCTDCTVTAAFTPTVQCQTVSIVIETIGNGALSNSIDYGDGSLSTNNITHDYAVAGTYDVCLTSLNTAADGDTCSNTICHTVTVAATTASIAGNTTICNGQSTTLTASNGAAYQWSNTEATASISVIAADTYTVTVTDSNSCTATASVNVIVSPDSTPTISGDDSFCEGQNTVLSVDLVGTYQWSNTETTPTITVTDAGVYSVTVTPTNGCSGVATIDVSTLPAPVVSISGSSAICEGVNTTLTASPDNSTYIWSNDATTASIDVNSASTYTVTVTDSNTCTASASIVVDNLPTLPATELTCAVIDDTSLEVSWTAVAGATAYVLTHNGETINMANTETSYSLTGVLAGSAHDFSLVAVGDAAMCDSPSSSTSCTTTVTVDCATIDAAISLQSSPISPVIVAETVTVSATVSNMTEPLTYTWASDDEPMECELPCNSISEMITKPAVYSVTVTDANGCTASSTLLVDVILPNKVIIPTAFTPNNTEPNNIFRIVGYNIAEYRLLVYDRFGNKVYDSGVTTDITTGWDGIYGGRQAELNVYAFFTDVLFNNGERQHFQGNVTLVR